MAINSEIKINKKQTTYKFVLRALTSYDLTNSLRSMYMQLWDIRCSGTTVEKQLFLDCYDGRGYNKSKKSSSYIPHYYVLSLSTSSMYIST